MAKKSVVNLNSQIYYQGKYWNDLPQVLAYMCQNFTGNKKKWWIDAFLENYGSFEHALFLNCGDGRHEVELYDKGIAKRITAFDISPELIKQAKKRKGRRKIDFFVADANTITFKKNQYDLVVNVAALHHVQYLNRLTRKLAEALKPGGYIVNFDYVGSHRNQYPLLSWAIVRALNELGPTEVKKSPIGYPHIPTMLATDPTEAIHSDLIEKMMGRYFHIVENNPTGGGIAYDLLTHNQSLNTVNKRILQEHVTKILFLDKWLVKLKLAPNLFSYIVATPNKVILKDKVLIKKWQDDENLREEIAMRNRGAYRLPDYLQLVRNTHGWKNRAYLMYEYTRSLPDLGQYYLRKCS